MASIRQALACAVLLSSSVVQSITLDITSSDSIKAAAKTAAAGLFSYYNGNQPGGSLGQLPYPPYYWWESGAMWGSLIHYWHYTGDETYVNDTIVGIQAQTGSANNFEPVAQAFDLGNDDQAFWALSTMSAVEYNFPAPPKGQPSWLALTQAVFNRQASRWDTGTCGGGLRWQLILGTPGYDYKNSISNGCLFNIAARLAKYTGNSTYSDWAAKIYDWELSVNLIDASAGFQIYDGVSASQNCTELDHLQWSYVLGVHLYGAAVMWNITGSQEWYDRTQQLLDSSFIYFRSNDANTTSNIMWEAECEQQGNCDADQLSFKGYLSRFMATTTSVAPWTYDTIMAHLQPSAQAAALSCTGGTSGTDCGSRWYQESYDSLPGAGQQICALEVFQGLLIQQTTGPITTTTGGTSTSDPGAGAGPEVSLSTNILDITTKDRAGAWILTSLCAAVTLGGGAWVVL